MGATHSDTHRQKKEKVEKLFRQNARSGRSRSLDSRIDRKMSQTSQTGRLSKDRSRMLGDGVDGAISGLSIEEKRMIELCWLRCTHRQLKRCSENIFEDILLQERSLLKLFRLDKTAPNRLREDEYFKSHASNFAIVLNLVITNIQNNFEQTCEALQTLGYQHVALRPRGFQSVYWDIFTDCFERNRPLSFRKEVEKEAWSRLILFILAQMKIGYNRGVATQNLERLSIATIY